MDEDYSHIVSLIIASFDGPLDTSRKGELDTWINKRPHRRQMVEQLRKQPIPPEWRELDKIDLGVYWKEMQARIASKTEIPVAKEHHSKLK